MASDRSGSARGDRLSECYIKTLRAPHVGEARFLDHLDSCSVVPSRTERLRPSHRAGRRATGCVVESGSRAEQRGIRRAEWCGGGGGAAAA